MPTRTTMKSSLIDSNPKASELKAESEQQPMGKSLQLKPATRKQVVNTEKKKETLHLSKATAKIKDQATMFRHLFAYKRTGVKTGERENEVLTELSKESVRGFIRTKIRPVVTVVRSMLNQAKSLSGGNGVPKSRRNETEEVIKEVGSNDYRLLKELGSGGFSHVYAARRRKRRGTMAKITWLRKSGKWPPVEYEPTVYAVKVCETNQDKVYEKLREEVPSWASWQVHDHMVKATSVEEISQEVSMLKSLQGCEHIVVLHQAFTVKNQDQVFLVMERLVVTLSKVSRDDAFDKHPKARAIVLRQLLEGICFLKSRNVIHRDIKSSNVMLSSIGLVKICDFGLSERVESEEKLISSGNEAGSDQYMAPELYVRDCEYDYGVDVWAFGVVAVKTFWKKNQRFHKFKVRDWERWRQGNGHHFGSFLGGMYATPEEADGLNQQYYLELLEQCTGSTAETKERKAKLFWDVVKADKNRLKSLREKNLDFIEMARSCLIPLPSLGPDGDITRSDLLSRATAEEVLSMKYFKPHSELSARQVVVALVSEYKESDDERLEELPTISL